MTKGAESVSALRKRRRTLKDLVRPNVRAMEPYRCARDDYEEGLLLDANENSLGPPFPAESQIDLDWARYPSPYQWPLREAIAKYRGVSRDEVFVGVGSDEAIDLLLRVFVSPGGRENIVVTAPSYGMYRVAADLNEVAVKQVQLDQDFQIDVEQMLSAVDEDTKIVFLCSPGNPTAALLRKEDIVRLLESEFDGLVVVDEAYIDFCAPGSSCVNLVAKYKNLVVTQTLSKAFGLAGIRLGMALASREVVELLNKVKMPYNVNRLTEKYALQAFENLDRLKHNVEYIIKERDLVVSALRAMPGVERVYHSDANFVLFKSISALRVYRRMAERGVVIRYRGSSPQCENCLRVTIGRRQENEKFLAELERALAEEAEEEERESERKG